MQERRRTVAIATEKGREWKRVCRGELEPAVRSSVVDGRRSFMEKGRKMRFSVVKSVKKYQIVRNDQKPRLGMHGLRTFKRLRNSRHKSCKKELIPRIDYVIVSIILEKRSTSAAVRMYGTAARLGSCNCRIRRMWRK